MFYHSVFNNYPLTCFEVVSSVPVMKSYHGYWPVLAIIKQYLGNVKKNLARDLNVEQDDTCLPGSNKSRKVEERKRKAFNKAPKHTLGGSELGSESEGQSEDEKSGDEEDEVDLEDDKAEMEMYEHYTKGLGHNNNQEDDEGQGGDDQEIPLVDKPVEY